MMLTNKIIKVGRLYVYDTTEGQRIDVLAHKSLGRITEMVDFRHLT